MWRTVIIKRQFKKSFLISLNLEVETLLTRLPSLFWSNRNYLWLLHKLKALRRIYQIIIQNKPPCAISQISWHPIPRPTFLFLLTLKHLLILLDYFKPNLPSSKTRFQEKETSWLSNLVNTICSPCFNSDKTPVSKQFMFS